MPLLDQLLWRKQALLESVGEPLKSACPIAHTYPRSVYQAAVCLWAAGVAYPGHEHKPALPFTEQEPALLASAFQG
jgi:hypothetical protein